ncbi:MAG: SlyX family protein [Porticoccaceae bacterium]|jgi:uncharacterized coiled-coil protein SlyX|nr:SlyX family protein [Porticoccaceae bacterium]MBT5578287.1 SlyX family protein [Porticoccaceae bacterium]MBT7374392.1 SlyX family protein [Porticoccaceae bacterium]
MDELRFEALEEKMAYLELTNAQLEDEIFRQQQEIDALTKAHRNMVQLIETLQDSASEQNLIGASGNTNTEKPPHY